MLELCDVNNPEQLIAFTGTTGSTGMLTTPQNMCLASGCQAGGCYPAIFLACDNTDARQLWFYNGTTLAFHNTGTGECLDAYSGYVCH